MGDQQSLPLNKVPSANKPAPGKCRVKDCKQNHSTHFCKICRDPDSQHYSYLCKETNGKTNKLPNSRGSISKNKCQVKGCIQAHQQHYCKVCHNKNADHYASGCPFGITLFHGTKLDAAISIQKTGFRPSTSGCIGAGVYFTDSYKDAAKIAKRWGGEAAVLECRLDNDSEFVNDRIHEPWIGITQGEFKEFVVREQYIKRIKIVKLHKV